MVVGRQDGTYMFSFPVPFVQTINVSLDGVVVASLDYSFNTFSRYLDVLYLALGVLGSMILVLLVTFQIVRRAYGLRRKLTSRDDEDATSPESSAPSVVSKLPKLPPLSLAPIVNARRKGANQGNRKQFQRELERQGSTQSMEEHGDMSLSVPEEEQITTTALYVGTELKPPRRLKRRSEFTANFRAMFAKQSAESVPGYSRTTEQRRLRFSKIMKRPPKRLNREATDKLRGNEVTVKESELDEAQRKALAEMKLAALVKYERFVPRSYLAIAVWLEGTVCHTEEFERCFGMDVFTAARTIHTFLVETVPPSKLKPVGSMSEAPKDGSLVRDGFYFATLAIVHLTLVSAFSSGLFISRQMLTSVTTSISLAVALALFFALPFMTSMSENSSYYLYQGLYGLVPQVVSRDLAAGLCASVIPSIFSVVVSLVFTEDILLSLLIGVFAFLFGGFMLLYTMMYLFNGPYEQVILPSGRHPAFVALVLLMLLAPFVVSVAVNPKIADQYFWINLHVISILAADIAIVLRLRTLAKAWLGWLPEKISLAHWMKKTDSVQFEDRLKQLSPAQRKEALYIVNAKQVDPATWATYKVSVCCLAQDLITPDQISRKPAEEPFGITFLLKPTHFARGQPGKLRILPALPLTCIQGGWCIRLCFSFYCCFRAYRCSWRIHRARFREHLTTPC